MEVLHVIAAEKGQNPVSLQGLFCNYSALFNLYKNDHALETELEARKFVCKDYKYSPTCVKDNLPTNQCYM